MVLVVKYSPQQFFFQPRLHPSHSSQRHLLFNNGGLPVFQSKETLTHSATCEATASHQPDVVFTCRVRREVPTQSAATTPQTHDASDLASHPAEQTAPPPPPQLRAPRPPPPRRQTAPAARQTQAATCTSSRGTNRTTPATARSKKSTNCTLHASGDVHAVPHDEPHHPHHRGQPRVRRNVRGRHSDDKHQRHAAHKPQLADRPVGQTAPPPPPCPPPRPPPPRRQTASSARQIQAATCTPSRGTKSTTPGTVSTSTSAAVTPTISTSCTPHASGNVHFVQRDKPHRPRHHVQLHVRRHHASKQRKLHAKRKRQLARRRTPPVSSASTSPLPHRGQVGETGTCGGGPLVRGRQSFLTRFRPNRRQVRTLRDILDRYDEAPVTNV